MTLAIPERASALPKPQGLLSHLLLEWTKRTMAPERCSSHPSAGCCSASKGRGREPGLQPSTPGSLGLGHPSRRFL